MNELNPNFLRTPDLSGAEALAKTQPVRPAVGRSAAGKTEPEPGTKVPAERPPAQEAKQSSVSDAIATLNDYVQSQQRDLRFTLDAELGRPVVKVLDSETQEVIRQIPNDVVLRLARNVKDLTSDDLVTSGAGAAGDSLNSTGSAPVELINVRA